MTTCPVCEVPLTMAVAPADIEPPATRRVLKAGDLALCQACRCWLIFDTPDQVRALTKKEWGALSEEKRMELTAIREQVPTR